MNYTKMHGAGNSFLILESPRREEKGEDLSDLALRLCSEKTGPGADGLIVVLPGEPGVDFSMLFYNADGSLGEMCGNGARCVARYAVEQGLSPDPEHICFRATAGLITARRMDRERYEVCLPDPSVIDLDRVAEGERCAYVELGDPGLPHAVLEVPPEAFDDLDALRQRGRLLRRSAAFPGGAAGDPHARRAPSGFPSPGGGSGPRAAPHRPHRNRGGGNNIVGTTIGRPPSPSEASSVTTEKHPSSVRWQKMGVFAFVFYLRPCSC